MASVNKIILGVVDIGGSMFRKMPEEKLILKIAKMQTWFFCTQALNQA
jgi:hypothetical protein